MDITHQLDTDITTRGDLVRIWFFGRVFSSNQYVGKSTIYRLPNQAILLLY